MNNKGNNNLNQYYQTIKPGTSKAAEYNQNKTSGHLLFFKVTLWIQSKPQEKNTVYNP